MFEFVKSARHGKSLVEHFLSLLLAGGTAAEFWMLPQFGTSTFLLFVVICFVDLFAGLAASLRRARRAVVVAEPVPVQPARVEPARVEPFAWSLPAPSRRPIRSPRRHPCRGPSRSSSSLCRSPARSAPARTSLAGNRYRFCGPAFGLTSASRHVCVPDENPRFPSARPLARLRARASRRPRTRSRAPPRSRPSRPAAARPTPP